MKKLSSRIVFLICIVLIWEAVYRLAIFPELLFPSASTIFAELVNGFTQYGLLSKTLNSLRIIFDGMFLGIIIAVILMGLSQGSKLFHSIVDNLVVFLSPIPSIAIFPLCILWFGIGRSAIMFIMVHAVLWTALRNMLSGFKSIPDIYKEVGLNLELNRYQMLKDIYIPACMPLALSCLKVSFAKAWRTAITVELVAGVIANNTGLGGHITFQRSMLNIPGLYATIVLIIVVGIIFEDIIFRALENHTVMKWGMMK